MAPSLGLATFAVSCASFLLLLLALWVTDVGDTVWRGFGSAMVAAFAFSHGSLVAGARRDTDSAGVLALSTASIALAVVDASFGILAISGVVEEVEEGFAQTMAVLLVLLLLTTALPPILRRLQRAGAASERRDGPGPSPVPAHRKRAAHGGGPSAGDQMAALQPSDLIAVADRIEALNARPDTAPEIRRECECLRQLAQTHLR